MSTARSDPASQKNHRQPKSTIPTGSVIMERLQDAQGLTDCISAHTLIEVGERHEAVDFCLSVLRQPAKTLTGLQTQAYLAVLLAVIDENADKNVQLNKARKLWHRIKGKHDNAYGVSGEAREISKRNTDTKWNGVMQTLDETEANFKKDINAAKLPLENKITVLENDLLVAKGKITLLGDQSRVKQDKIDALQAEIALLKTRSLDYSQSSAGLKQPPPASSNWIVPWPLSLCLTTNYDSADELDTTIGDNTFAQNQTMTLDKKAGALARYSTCGQLMTKKENGSPTSVADKITPIPEGQEQGKGRLSDLDMLMMNGPILVRPGKPLAYVNDEGQIIEVQVDIEDLPPMMFPHGKLKQGASRASLSTGRHKSTRF